MINGVFRSGGSPLSPRRGFTPRAAIDEAQPGARTLIEDELITHLGLEYYD
jgi:hypothetical protein